MGKNTRLYKAGEVAEMLGLSKQTVWKYGREGKLNAVRFGRTVRYDIEGGRNVQTGNHYTQVHEDR